MKRSFAVLGLVLLLIGVVVLSGCVVCQKPLIKGGKDCCLDADDNKICDDAEKQDGTTSGDDGKTTTPATDYQTADDTQTPEPTAADDTSRTVTLTWEELGEKIDGYYSSDYLFRASERDYKLTEFEQSYNVYSSSIKKFQIYEIKDSSDYLTTFDDFSTYTDKLHEVMLKDEKMTNDAQLAKLIDSSINNANAHYNVSYNKFKKTVGKNDVFYENGLVIFGTQWNYFISARFIYGAYVWCTPNMIVRVEAPAPIVAKQTTLEEALSWDRMRPKLTEMEEKLPTDVTWVLRACGKV